MSGGPQCFVNSLPDELLSRILVAAATKPTDFHLTMARTLILSRVCKRWRALCFSTGDLWEMLWLTAPCYGRVEADRQPWLNGKLWLLQRIGSLVRRLHIQDDHVAQDLMQPLLLGAPCALRSLSLRMLWGPHLAGLPQLLALAHTRFTSLERLEISAPAETGSFRLAAQQQPGLTAAQLEARLFDGVLAGIAALAGTLTELKLSMPPVELPSLAPLTALRRLRQLEVSCGHAQVRLLVPAPAQFPLLEGFQLRGRVQMQLPAPQAEEDLTFAAASWAAAPAGTLGLEGVEVAALPALLAALRLPAAGPLERLLLQWVQPGANARAAVAAVEACAPQLQHVRELSVVESPGVTVLLLEALLRLLPRLESLHLTICGLSALPAEPSLSSLRSLSLFGNKFTELPPALLRASRLHTLDLQFNSSLQPSEPDLRQLLRALPELRQLDLRHTGISKEAAEGLTAAAADRGLTVQLPDFKPPQRQGRWWSDEDEAAFYSSDSDSSDDGCPRFSWAGCAYASRW